MECKWIYDAEREHIITFQLHVKLTDIKRRLDYLSTLYEDGKCIWVKKMQPLGLEVLNTATRWTEVDKNDVGNSVELLEQNSILFREKPGRMDNQIKVEELLCST